MLTMYFLQLNLKLKGMYWRMIVVGMELGAHINFLVCLLDLQNPERQQLQITASFLTGILDVIRYS